MNLKQQLDAIREDFELEDSRGDKVSLADLLERGPLVMTFFRGHW